MLLLDGKIIKETKAVELRKAVRGLGFTPTLAIVQIGSGGRSREYIAAKQKFAQEIGAAVELVGFGSDVSTDDVLYEIHRLNADPSVNGIIVQLPVPRDIDRRAVLEAVDPSKDVDGLTAHSLKSLLENDRNGFVPATAKGIISLLDYYGILIEGKQVAIVGRSLLVGKTTALSFLNRNATVTVCHRFTNDLPQATKPVDILVVAVGKPNLVGREHVSPGQTVVDVGINLSGGEKLAEEIPAPRVVGDVDFAAVKDTVSAISPVPGGVGPMTVLSLFENLLEAARRQTAGL